MWIRMTPIRHKVDGDGLILFRRNETVDIGWNVEVDGFDNGID